MHNAFYKPTNYYIQKMCKRVKTRENMHITKDNINEFIKKVSDYIKTDISRIVWMDTDTRWATIFPRCPICRTTMNNYHKFPDWYPEKWRVCCYCHDAFNYHYNITQNLTYTMSPYLLESHYEEHKKELEKRFIIQ